MKVLYFDRSGFCIWAKRLEAGRFVSDWAQVRTREMDWTGLKLMLEGIEPRSQKKRYRLPKSLQNSTSNTSSNTVSALSSADGPRTDEQAPERG
jgi:hypothetical protein